MEIEIKQLSGAWSRIIIRGFNKSGDIFSVEEMMPRDDATRMFLRAFDDSLRATTGFLKGSKITWALCKILLGRHFRWPGFALRKRMANGSSKAISTRHRRT